MTLDLSSFIFPVVIKHSDPLGNDGSYHAFNPSPQASLVYRMSSRTDKTTLISRKANNNKQTNILSRDQFIICFLASLYKAALKPVNYEKLQEVIQDKQENPSQILECFRKALLQYTNLNPENPEGQQLLMIYFFFPRATLTWKLNLGSWRRGP